MSKVICMTRDEAQARADELNRTASGPSEHRWIARELEPGGWQVLKVTVPGMNLSSDRHTATEQRPEPGEPPDPRPLIIRQIPPYGAG